MKLNADAEAAIEPPALVVSNMSCQISDDFAIEDVSFSCSANSLTAIVGRNGSGKTSLLDVICGRLRAHRGTVTVNGRNVTGLSYDRIVRAGVGRMFQRAGLPHRLTVSQVIWLASGNVPRWPSLFNANNTRRLPLSDDAVELLTLFDLFERSDMPAGTLSYGQTRLLALAACLVRRPTLVLLDEPLAGLDQNHVARVLGALTSWRHRTHVGMLVVEHNIRAVWDAAEQLVLLDRGRVIALGDPKRVLGETRAREVFLG